MEEEHCDKTTVFKSETSLFKEVIQKKPYFAFLDLLSALIIKAIARAKIATANPAIEYPRTNAEPLVIIQ